MKFATLAMDTLEDWCNQSQLIGTKIVRQKYHGNLVDRKLRYAVTILQRLLQKHSTTRLRKIQFIMSSYPTMRSLSFGAVVSNV